jgi:hypothetical protein
MGAALQGGQGGAAPPAPAGPAPSGPQTPMAGIPPELAAIAFELGLDIRKPEDLAILLQLFGQGGGGPLGPMAGAAPGGGDVPPESY